MPNSGLAEIYFISAMFILIFVICTVACFFFFRTFQREKKQAEAAKLKKQTEVSKSEIPN